AIALFISKGNAAFENISCGQCIKDLCSYPCLNSTVSACENCINIDVPRLCKSCVPGTCKSRNPDDNKTCDHCIRKICGPPCNTDDSSCKNCLDIDIPNLCGCCNKKN
ncbi:hypothetical protein Mgra_00000524, partial [Meloidogyne graminicola]